MSAAQSDKAANPSLSNVPDGLRVTRNIHKDEKRSKYLLPSDDRELNRQDLQHFVVRHLMHGNFNAPIEDLLQEGIKVLDAGCGTGQWILEMAEDYPQSTFVGIDISENFPKAGNIPPNCAFLKANTLEGLPFADGEFGYVFQRFMVAAFSPSDWPIAVRELTRLTEPGGWLEFLEGSTKLERFAVPTTLSEAFSSATKDKDFGTESVFKIGDMLVAAGLQDIESDHVCYPIGWGGRVGELQRQNIHSSCMSLAPLIQPILKVCDDEYRRIVDDHIQSLRRQMSWTKLPYAFGRKAARC